MQIILRNVRPRLVEKGIDLSTEEGISKLSKELYSAYSCTSFGYDHAHDLLTIDVSNGIAITNEFGEVTEE